MIRENSTQRGNENFGAVLDSVGAVLVQCVRNVYIGGPTRASSESENMRTTLEKGQGIGRRPIKDKEPSIPKHSIDYSLNTFRNTGTYLALLKKGGLPKEFWHLYEKPQTTTIEAVALFPKPAPPIQITDDIQVSLNRLGRDLETHAESGIRIGKELIYLKEITPHGQFGALVEWAYGLNKRTCRNYIQVAEKFGNQIGRQRPFSNQVLIELSRPSTPESAREEAVTKDSLTVKKSKELTTKHKEMQKEIDALAEENTRLKKDGTPVAAVNPSGISGKGPRSMRPPGGAHIHVKLVLDTH